MYFTETPEAPRDPFSLGEKAHTLNTFTIPGMTK